MSTAATVQADASGEVCVKKEANLVATVQADASGEGCVKKAPEAKTPQERFRNHVIDAVRQSGGVMDAALLYKQVMDKRALKTIGLEHEQAKTLLYTIMKECFVVSDGKNFYGALVVSLNPQFGIDMWVASAMARRVELWDDALVLSPNIVARAAVLAFGDELMDLQWLPRAEAVLRQELHRRV